jgi:hypothetical protein
LEYTGLSAVELFDAAKLQIAIRISQVVFNTKFLNYLRVTRKFFTVVPHLDLQDFASTHKLVLPYWQAHL